MILILSFASFEQCTDPVIDWLIYHKANFIKITYEDLYNSKNKISFDIKKEQIIYKGIDLTKKINSVYYRRFTTNIKIPEFRSDFPIDQALHELTYEMDHLTKYFFYLLKNKKWLPYPLHANLDKLTSLTCAKKAGLNIPASFVANNKNDLDSFMVTEKKYITKPIKFSGYYNDKQGNTYTILTHSVSKKFIQSVDSDFFFPTLIQEKIDYEFEIRIFYLDGKFFPAAIIVSNTDYDDIKHHFGKAEIHWIPFQLPSSIMEKLNKFMKSVELNTGSIDMMKTKAGEYFFIEVNPVGQFIAPSKRCNYKIEKEIAEWLIRNDE